MNQFGSKCLRATATLFVLLITASAGQVIQDRALHNVIKRGIDLAGRQQYSEAGVLFDEAIRRWPQHPAGFLNKAILFEVMSLDFETPLHEDYDGLLQKTIELGEKMSETNSAVVEVKYYIGMAHAYISYEKYRTGEDWFSGLKHGFKAYGYLKECLELKPDAFDAMTGFGTYKYWKSKKTEFLSWLPFIEDERYAGINYLKMAEVKGMYTSAQATNSLIWIYIEEERYSDAMRAAQHILKRYPKHRLFLWGLATAAERKGDWQIARTAYEEIVGSIDDEVTEKRYIEIQARAKIARMSFNLRDFGRAAKECDWVLANGVIPSGSFTDDGATRIKRRMADMEALRQELARLPQHRTLSLPVKQ